MTITPTVSSIRIAAGTGTLTGTFSNVNIPAGSRLVVSAACNGGSTNTPSINVTSPNLTWTPQVTATGTAPTKARASIFTAPDDTGHASETITVTITGQDSGAGDTNASLYVCSGAAPSSFVGNFDTYVANDNDPDSATSGEAEITTSGVNSIVIWTAIDWDASGLVTPTISNSTLTVDDSYIITGEATHYAVHTATIASSTTQTRLVINPTADGKWVCVGIELKASVVVTANLSPVTATVSPQALSATPGVITVNLTPIPVAATVQSLSATPDMITVNLAPISVSVTPQALPATPDVITVNLTLVSLTITVLSLTVTPGVVTVNLIPVDISATVLPVATGNEQTLNFPAPVITNGDDAALYALGTEWSTAQNGFWVGAEWDVPTSVAGNNHYIEAFIMTGFNSADWIQSKLFTPVPGTRQKIYFDTPIAVLSTEAYCQVVITQHYTATVSYPWPQVNGSLTAPDTKNGRLAGTSPDSATFPSNISGNAASFHISPIFTTDTVTPTDVSLVPVTVQMDAISVTATPGMVTVSLGTAVSSVSAMPVGGTPGVITVNLSPAAMDTAAIPVSATPGAFMVSLVPASVTAIAVPLTPVAGGVLVNLAPVTATIRLRRAWLPKAPTAPYAVGTEVGVPTGTTLIDRFPVGSPDGTETFHLWNPYTGDETDLTVQVWDSKRFTTDSITPSVGSGQTLLFRNCKFDIPAVNRLFEADETNQRLDIMSPLVIFDHCEVDGHSLSTRGVVGSFIWMQNTFIHNCEDGWAGLAYSLAWKCVYIADDDGGPDPHADGTQLSGTGHTQVLESWCSGGSDPLATNSGERFATESSAVTDIVLEFNTYDYGGYSLQVRGDAGAGPGITDVTVEHCRWTRAHLYGPVDFEQVTGVTWNDNKYLDGESIGSPVAPVVNLVPIDLVIAVQSASPGPTTGLAQLSPIQITLSALTMTATPGMVTVNLSPVLVAVSARSLVTITAFVVLSPANIALAAIVLSISTGIARDPRPYDILVIRSRSSKSVTMVRPTVKVTLE